MTMDDLQARIARATQLLEELAEEPGLLVEVDDAARERLLIAAGQVSRPDKAARRALARARARKEKNERRDADQALLDRTGIRRLRESPIFITPRRPQALMADGRPVALETEALLVEERRQRSGQACDDGACDDGASERSIGQTAEERVCYVCRKSYTDVHFFYDQMCLECGDFNYGKRFPEGDLRGRVALVTGARVKIGYQAAIMLLRAGARVICVTRFPNDAAKRYAAEEDFEQWGDRLTIYGLDLRHTPSVELFCRHLNATLDRLDFLINNACQTVRRPAGFYDHLMAGELAGEGLSAAARALVGSIDGGRGAAAIRDALLNGNAAGDEALAHVTTSSAATASTTGASALMSQIELLAEDRERGNHLFPAGQLDADLQQVDLRKVNSWRLKLDEVSAIELLEVQLVNAVAPYILNARLRGLMRATPTRDKHIVNVSAVEGQFYRVFKTDRHPHTNMAKAALNMMTRTSAIDYLDDGIHMNSVDTGWVTDEDPIEQARAKREIHRFHPPLDIVDGAARIVDPIFSGINTGRHAYGQFLKDYRAVPW